MIRFHDGRRAVGWPARIRADARALTITPEGSPEGAPPVVWTLKALRATGPDPEGRITLAPRGEDARLVLDRADIPDTLAARVRLPEPHRGGWTGLGLAVGLSLAVVAAIIVGAPNLLAPLIPRAWQAPLGDRVLNMLELGKHRCVGQPGLDDLTALMSRLTDAARIRPVRLTVLDDATINALTLPGDRVVIFRGLIDAADGDELAAVIGHELGHVRHHDSLKPVIRELGFSIVLLAVGGGDGGFGGVGRDLANLSFSRSVEAAADASAIETLHAAGLRADGLARFFAGMDARAKHPGMEIPRWLATHPTNAAREQAAEAAAGDAGEPAFTEDQLDAIKVICEPD